MGRPITEQTKLSELKQRRSHVSADVVPPRLVSSIEQSMLVEGHRADRAVLEQETRRIVDRLKK
jgi:hypothetical protein